MKKYKKIISYNIPAIKPIAILLIVCLFIKSIGIPITMIAIIIFATACFQCFIYKSFSDYFCFNRFSKHEILLSKKTLKSLYLLIKYSPSRVLKELMTDVKKNALPKFFESNNGPKKLTVKTHLITPKSKLEIPFNPEFQEIKYHCLLKKLVTKQLIIFAAFIGNMTRLFKEDKTQVDLSKLEKKPWYKITWTKN